MTRPIEPRVAREVRTHFGYHVDARGTQQPIVLLTVVGDDAVDTFALSREQAMNLGSHLVERLADGE